MNILLLILIFIIDIFLLLNDKNKMNMNNYLLNKERKV